MALLLLTVTSGRPRCFERLTKYITSQTTDDFRWLVVTDDYNNYQFTPDALVVKREHQPGDNSLCANLLTAIEWIKARPEYNQIILMEDDDWYCQTYVRETKKLFEKGNLIGWHENAYYYVLSRKSRRCHNKGFAALATTGFDRSVIPYLESVCKQNTIFVDKMLWNGIVQETVESGIKKMLPDGSTIELPPQKISRVTSNFQGRKCLADNFTGLLDNVQPVLDKHGSVKDEYPRHVGLKQNWHQGKSGISQGHDPNVGGGIDMGGKTLKKWLGEDEAKFYLTFTRDIPSNPYPPGIIIEMPISEFDAVR